MKKVLAISGNKFPQKTFAVLIVVALVAFLLTLKPVAEAVKKTAESLGVTFPPLDVFRNVASQIQNLAIGLIALTIGVAVGLVGLKVALIAAAVGIVVYSGYMIYKSLFKGETNITLPEFPKKD